MATTIAYAYQFQINWATGNLELVRYKTITITTAGGGNVGANAALSLLGP